MENSEDESKESKASKAKARSEDARTHDPAFWDSAIRVSNSLFQNRAALNLQFPCSLEHFTENLYTLSGQKRKAVVGSIGASNGTSNVNTTNFSNFAYTEGKVDHAHVDSAQIAAAEINTCIAEFDRVQMCLVKALLESMHQLMELQEQVCEYVVCLGLWLWL